MENMDRKRSSEDQPNGDLLKDVIFSITLAEWNAKIVSKTNSKLSSDVVASSLDINDLLDEIYDKFEIDATVLHRLQSDLHEEYSPGEVEISVENITLSGIPVEGDGSFLECHLILGEEQVVSTKIAASPQAEWQMDVKFPVKNLFTDQVDAHFWHFRPKEGSDNIGKMWRRSLDSFGQRLRCSLRSRAPHEEIKVVNKKCRSLSTSPSQKTGTGAGNVEFSAKKQLEFRRSFSSNDNWVMNAFASFKQPKIGKQSFNRCNSLEGKISTDLPTTRVGDNAAFGNAAVDAIKDSFSTYQNSMSLQSIEVKDEINVQRQCMPVVTSRKPPLVLKGRRTDSPGLDFISNREKGSETFFSPFKSKSMRLSPKKDLQLWRRMSVSIQEKITEALEQHVAIGIDEDVQKSDSISKPVTRKSSISTEEGNDFTKDYLGCVTISLLDCFMNSNYCNWTAIEKIKLNTSIVKENEDIPKATVSLRYRAKAESPHSSSAFNCFKLTLEKLYDPQIAIVAPKKDHRDLILPTNVAAKAIMKTMAFAFDLSDAEVSLASWLIISEKLLLPSHMGDKDSGIRTPSITVHPALIYHWLTKLDALGSHYNSAEHQQVGRSVYRFVKEVLSSHFERLHASFPISCTSQLLHYLRCCHLLSESASLQHAVNQFNEVPQQWAVNILLSAVKEHVQNWVSCLTEEMVNQPPIVGDLMISSTNSESIILPTFCKTLMSQINKAEITLMTVNDFLILGERVYEPAFQSELNISYMNTVWRYIGEASIHFLEPIKRELSGIFSQGLSLSQLKELLEIHPSLWILLLQLSKLYRFQTRRENQDYLSWYLPESFCESFLLLTYLWTDFALTRASESITLEIESDSFAIEGENAKHLSSSAQEIDNVIKVMQEKIFLLSFPGGYITKGKICDHFMPKLLNMIKKYRIEASTEVLKRAVGQNTVTAEMCTLANNMQILSQEAEKFILSLHICRDRCKERIDQLQEEVKEMCHHLLVKRFPGMTHLVGGVLNQEDDASAGYYIISGITSLLQPVSDMIVPAHPIILHLWSFLFGIFTNLQRKLVQTREYRRLGYAMETLYMHFQSYYGLQCTAELEEEFQSLMDHITIKAMPSDEIIQKYYTERYEEQVHIHSSGPQQLVVNAYFAKGSKGLVLNIFMGPTLDSESLDCMKVSSCGSSFSNIAEEGTLIKSRHFNAKKFSKKANEIFSNTSGEAANFTRKIMKTTNTLFSSIARSKNCGIYVKASLEPAEWFKDVKCKKTRIVTQNPPVFDEELNFNIAPDWIGIKRGGYLLLRLKVSTAKFSNVHSEAVLPLMDVPVINPQGKRNIPHTYLGLSRPGTIQDYKALMELKSRYDDRMATSFLNRLRDCYWL